MAVQQVHRRQGGRVTVDSRTTIAFTAATGACFPGGPPFHLATASSSGTGSRPPVPHTTGTAHLHSNPHVRARWRCHVRLSRDPLTAMQQSHTNPKYLRRTGCSPVLDFSLKYSKIEIG